MKTLSLIGFGVLLLCASMASQAQISKQSSEMFNSMINSTSPKVVHGARRGVISGGGVTVKNRMMSFNLYNFTPPRINAGCGGIDAFAGSLSMISKEQLIDVMRSIASSALGYAFRLALAAMCPQCEARLADLQRMVNQWNMGTLNTCQIGEAIANQAVGPGTPANDSFANAGVAMGLREDTAAASNQNTSESTALDLADEGGAGELMDLLPGNEIWNAMARAKVGEWLGDDSDILREEIMSFTGTVIVCIQGVKKCSQDSLGDNVGQKGRTLFWRVEHVMTLKDLVEGTDIKTKDPKILRCSDGTDINECLMVTVDDRPQSKGLKNMVLDIMLGENRQGGLLRAQTEGTRAPTAEEAGFISNAGQFGQLALRLGRQSEHAARMFVMEFSENIAAELAYNLIASDLHAALVSLSNQKKGDVTMARNMVLEAIARVMQEKGRYDKKAKSKSSVLEYYARLSKLIERQSPVASPLGAIN